MSGSAQIPPGLTVAPSEALPPANAAPAAGLPSVESILGPAPAQGSLPSVEDILGPAPTEAQQTTSGIQTGARMALMGVSPLASIFMGHGFGAPASPKPDTMPSGPDFENFLSHTAVGRVLSQFGQGIEQGWGGGTQYIGHPLENILKEAGIHNDIAKGQSSILRAFNEGLIWPAAVMLDRTAQAAAGALFAAGSGATKTVGQTATELLGPSLGRDIGGMFEYEMTGQGALRGLPGHPSIDITEPLPRTPVDIPAARDLGVIGTDGDGAYMGTAPRGSVPDTAALREAVQEQQAAAPPPGEGTAPVAAQPIVPDATPTPMDVHAVARSIAPDTFAEYDALIAHQAELRTSLANSVDALRQQAEAQAPGAAEIADLQARMADTTPRLAKKYAARLAELQPAHDAFLSDEFTMGALTRDTPEIAALRQQLLETDFRMRDLAPDVTAAYREAAKQFPEPVETVPVVPQQAEPIATEAPQPPPEGGAAPAAPEVPARPAEAPPAQTQEAVAQAAPKAAEPPLVVPQSIAADVSAKMQAAGRPAEEADAAGQVSEAMWRTRAQAFEGRKGTPEEMYAREAPEIRGQRQTARQREMAQSDTPARSGARGKIRLTEDGRAIITLMRNANASTFLHETGHDWLERMMRDAADPDAPQAMRDDAATVRKYLGVEDGAELTTKAHEKFARSFERYFMEGRAPTAAMARVFAKFKEWLTAIYEAVAKLRAPITPDIRDVFDRLLSTANERAAIVADEGEPREPVAPSVATSQTAEAATAHLADLHEADLRDAEPPDAADVAKHVRVEVDRTVDAREPEVADEFRPGRTEGGTGGDTAPTGDTGEARGTAGPTAGEVGGAAKPDAIGPGGSGVAPDGDSAPGGQNPWTPSARSATRRPSGPNEPFAPAESGLIDKAGNIRLDNLDTSEDVKQVIRDAAAQNDDFIGARRGVISDADVIDLADALGMRPADLDRRKLGEAFNAEQVMAARKLLVQSATAVRDAMAKAVDGSDADVMAFAEARERHLMIQRQVAGITAEAGRALRAFRDLGGEVKDARLLGDILQNLTGKTLYQMRRAAKAGMELDTPEQVSKFLADSEKPGFWDMLMEYWINGLISGPATHSTYTVGNALLTLWRAVPETAATAAVGAVRRGLGGTGPAAEFGEVGAGLHAILFGQRQGIMAAWKSIKTGLTTELPGETEAGAQGSFIALQQTPKGAIPGRVGEVIRVPSRAVAAIHSYFRTINYEAEIAKTVYRKAAAEGLDGHAFAARVADLTANPDPAMMQQARIDATETVLMGRGGELTQKISELSRAEVFGAPLIKFVMPFVRIGSNVLRQSILERSPLGVLDAGIRDNLMGRNGSIARDAQIARIGVGSALGAVAVGLAAQGYLTGGGPSDPKQAAVWRMQGNQPYSVRIGETWVAMHRLGPLAMIMGIGADLHEFGAHASHADIGTIANMLVGSIAKNLLDESWMRGPSELMEAVQDPQRYGARYVRNQLATFVPFSVGMAQIARGMDPFAREARTLMDAIIQKFPGWSETLMPRRDIWGAPIANLSAVGGRAVSALTTSTMTHDPATIALDRLHVFPGKLRRDILGVPLTDQQYDAFQVSAGHLAHMMVSQIVTQPGFTVLPVGVQQRLLSETITKARASAATLMKMQHPEIIRQAVANKQSLLTVGRQPKP